MGVPVASTVVIESKQGIGDVVWHLPYIRAIAAVSPGGKVIFLARPSTHAQELLEAEPCVERTLYFESHGSELRRVVHQIRLIALLRRLKCDTAWFLDRTTRPAIASLLAGIPNRIGVGLGAQRWFITNAGIDRTLYGEERWAFVYLNALMQAMKVPYAGPEPEHDPRPRSCAVETLDRGRGSCSGSALRSRPRTGATRSGRNSSPASGAALPPCSSSAARPRQRAQIG